MNCPNCETKMSFRYDGGRNNPDNYFDVKGHQHFKLHCTHCDTKWCSTPDGHIYSKASHVAKQYAAPRLLSFTPKQEEFFGTLDNIAAYVRDAVEEKRRK